jgi:hypothetical protein
MKRPPADRTRETSVGEYASCRLMTRSKLPDRKGKAPPSPRHSSLSGAPSYPTTQTPWGFSCRAATFTLGHVGLRRHGEVREWSERGEKFASTGPQIERSISLRKRPPYQVTQIPRRRLFEQATFNPRKSHPLKGASSASANSRSKPLSLTTRTPHDLPNPNYEPHNHPGIETIRRTVASVEPRRRPLSSARPPTGRRPKLHPRSSNDESLNSWHSSRKWPLRRSRSEIEGRYALERLSAARVAPGAPPSTHF